MIDKTKKYWTGDSSEDISEYLRLYSEENDIDIKDIICHSCGGNEFNVIADGDESVIQVKCVKCGDEKLLLDSEEYLEDASLKPIKCPVCGRGGTYNVKVGFIRKENGSVKWVYIGNRCTECGVLGSCDDWPIDYEPTEDMEHNI